MRLKVDGNFFVKGLFEPPIYLDLEEGATLKDLMEKLAERCNHIELIRKDNNVQFGSDVEKVTLNNKEFLPTNDMLNVPLKDGDEVYIEVWMDPLGGG